MHLETAQDIEHKNVTEAQLREAFRNDKGRGEFIILSRDKERGQYFIQASGEGDEGYDLEYREGNDENHFRADGEYTKAQVEQAFVYYLNNDGRWRTDFKWQPLNSRAKKSPDKQTDFTGEKKPWWKFW